MSVLNFICSRTFSYVVVTAIAVVLVSSAVFWVMPSSEHVQGVASFEECVNTGNAVMESYPRQCRTADGNLFVEETRNELEKANLIHLAFPRPNTVIESPLRVRGEARGTWFFEASFPVLLTDWDGKIIAKSHATALRDWMTEDFVPFEATIEFAVPEYGERGTLILRKDNPSGLPEYDDALEISILFLLTSQ